MEENRESRKRVIYVLPINFDKGAKAIFDGKRNIFSRNSAGAIGSPHKIMNLDPYLIPYIILYLK